MLVFPPFIVSLGMDKNSAVNNIHSKNRHIISPQIKTTPRFNIKSGMVPVTGQYAILGASPT
jgi:hypothetical protein